MPDIKGPYSIAKRFAQLQSYVQGNNKNEVNKRFLEALAREIGLTITRDFPKVFSRDTCLIKLDLSLDRKNDKVNGTNELRFYNNRYGVYGLESQNAN